MVNKNTIYYIYFFGGKNIHPSIEKKIHEQAEAVKKTELDIEIIVINFCKHQEYNGIKYIKCHRNQIKNKYFRYSYIANIIENIDGLIYLRYIDSDFSNLFFFKKYGSRIITEHHCMEYNELSLVIKNKNIIKRFVKKFIEKYFI